MNWPLLIYIFFCTVTFFGAMQEGKRGWVMAVGLAGMLLTIIVTGVLP
jgi:hypothetical protein